MTGQGFFVNKITEYHKEYSYILLYLSEEENEAFDVNNVLHFRSSISWTGTPQGVKFRLKTNQKDINKTVRELSINHFKRMANHLDYIELIDEDDARDYMLAEVQKFILTFVVSCTAC
jgi:hypothetical protein